MLHYSTRPFFLQNIYYYSVHISLLRPIFHPARIQYKISFVLSFLPWFCMEILLRRTSRSLVSYSKCISTVCSWLYVMDHITCMLYSGHSSGGISSCCFQIAAPPLPSFCFNWVLVSQGRFSVWDQTGSSYQANGTANHMRQSEREWWANPSGLCAGCSPPLTLYVSISSAEASLAVSDRSLLVTTEGL